MFMKRVCSIITSTILLFTQTVYAAGVKVDTTAPKSNQANLENSQNGVPIVNIVAPNGSGVSHNKFKDYNVEQKGLILNNSQMVTKTQLAGYIDRNTNLDSSGSAKLILNEVTGTNRTLLQGYTEVAGKAADVIVANPNGISVNGGGFINTPKVTLTTGNPFFNGSNLGGFNIRGGDILIEGDGFNANNIDAVNLYSKALEINAKIYAQELNLVTGDSDISLDGTVNALETHGSGVAIDSSLLGGIYANMITFQSNDKGVGVNLPPEVIAQKDLTINVNGDIVLAKTVANEDISITATDGDINTTDEIAATNIEITSTNNLFVQADSIIEASENIDIQTKNTDNKGEIRAISDTSIVRLQAEQKILNDNNIYSKNDVILSAKELENNALIQADDDLAVIVENITNNTDGTIYAKDQMLLASNDIVNNGIIAANTLDIATLNIHNKGALYSTNDMTIQAQNLTNEEMIRSNDEINLLIENSLTNEQNGMIYADGDINILANEAKEKINTVTNKGVIQSHQDINVTAKTLNNTTSTPVYTKKTTSSTKTVQLGGSNNFNIVTTTVSTDVLTIPSDPALMLAEGDIKIDVETLNNYYSLISSDEDIILNANTANNVGKVAVTTTTVVTKQYRNEKYCSSSVCGACIKHKERAGYRGTFTSKSTSNVPVVNYGIQAKRTITGNVVTLNNVNNDQEILNEAEMIQKQNEINTVESNSIDLQNSIHALDDNNEQINLTVSEVANMEEKIDSVQTEEDFTTFKTDLTNIKSALEESITKDQENIDQLQAVIDYSKILDSSDTLAQEILNLETSLTALKSNLEENKTNLISLEEIESALVSLEDMGGQKQVLIDINTDIKDTLNNNTTVISEMENHNLTMIVSELEKIYNILSNDLKNILDEQEAVKQTVVSDQSGLYQTTNSPTLKTTNSVTIDTDSNNVVSKLTLPKNKFGLFTLSTNSKHTYLIESNPLYANYQTFISSDYMMGKLGYDPTQTIQRLGDAMYETTLIRNSIIHLSGQRYLEGYDTDLAQYKGLMDNAIEVQEDLNLSFGVALSKNQINRLTKDIVWMEEKVVEGNRVLVPVVYLASLSSNNLKDGTQIIAGEDIAIATAGTLQNQGKIEARNNLLLLSNNIQNHGGIIEAKNDATLQSNTDIDNISGDIKAGKDISLSANNNINIKSSTNKKTYNYAQGYQTTTLKGKDASVVAGGNLKVNVGDSVTVTGAKLQAGGDATIVAHNGDVNIDATKQKEKFDFDVYGGYYKGDSLQNSGSKVEAKNLTVLTNGNLNISGSTVKVEEDANIYAKDINITSTTDTSSSKYKSESKGFFSSSSTKQEKQSSKNIASLLQANNVNIDTGNLTLIASKIKANEAKITAEIINLISSKDSEYESNFSDSSGILTRTIETKGYIKEILKVAKIEVSDKLIVNNKDITNQLTTDNIIKTLSSQSNLSIEQINLIKATLNNKEWNDKTTTLSGVGALIVAIVVTVLTAGAGTALVGAATTTATTAATTVATTAITTASVQAAVVQSIVTGVTTQLATAVITGNSFKLDAQSLVKGAVSAGVMSYANAALSIDALNENMTFSDYAQNAAVRGTAQGISSEIMGGEFKDGFKTGATLSVFNDSALQMRKYIFDNYNYVGDGKLSEGLNGDGRKGGGSHPEKFYNEHGQLKPNPVNAPTGGSQMDKGYLFGTPYEAGSFKDNVIEHFAGPHDFMSSWNYENIDGVTYLKNNGGLVNTASGLLLIPAAPFAAAPFIQNNINELNTINYIRKQEEQKANNILETYNQNKQPTQEIQNEN